MTLTAKQKWDDQCPTIEDIADYCIKHDIGQEQFEKEVYRIFPDAGSEYVRLHWVAAIQRNSAQATAARMREDHICRIRRAREPLRRIKPPLWQRTRPTLMYYGE